MAASFLPELLLFPAALILPGLLFVRRRWAPLEQLLAAVVFSALGAYLVAFGLYLGRIPAVWFAAWAAAAA